MYHKIKIFIIIIPLLAISFIMIGSQYSECNLKAIETFSDTNNLLCSIQRALLKRLKCGVKSNLVDIIFTDSVKRCAAAM